jgi:hypothetical protein
LEVWLLITTESNLDGKDWGRKVRGLGDIY